MDALNAALYQACAWDSAYMAVAPGGMWHRKADDGTPLPLSKFKKASESPDYTFGDSVGCIRFVYQITSYAEDTTAETGASLAAIVNGHVKRVVNAASLTIPGFEVLSCRWFGLVPEGEAEGLNGRTEFYEGVLVEIILAPST